MIRYFVCNNRDVLVAKAEDWKELNPVILKGDYAVSSDTKEIRLGDGLTPWSSLSLTRGHVDEDYSDIVLYPN